MEWLVNIEGWPKTFNDGERKETLKMSQDKSKTYVFSGSDDSVDVYPSNTAYHFKTHLNSPLVVREGCEVGVSDFHCVDDLPVLQKEYIQTFVRNNSSINRPIGVANNIS